MTEANWALVGVTITLVLLTAWYATETHRTVKRMDREREETSSLGVNSSLSPDLKLYSDIVDSGVILIEH